MIIAILILSGNYYIGPYHMIRQFLYYSYIIRQLSYDKAVLILSGNYYIRRQLLYWKAIIILQDNYCIHILSEQGNYYIHKAIIILTRELLYE